MFEQAHVICKTMGYTNGAVDYTKESLFFLEIDSLDELSKLGFGNSSSHMLTIVQTCEKDDSFNINQCELQQTHFVNSANHQRDDIGGVICARNENETALIENDFIELSENSYGKVIVKNRYNQVGYICTNKWHIEMAEVACKQAGFETALAYTEYAMNLEDAFVMSYLYCFFPEIIDMGGLHSHTPTPPTPNHDKLQDCSYHAKDVQCQKAIAGVVCKDPNKESAKVYLEENGYLRAINDDSKLGAICAQHWSDKAVSQTIFFISSN